MAGTICWLLITQGGNTWICTIGGDWTKPNSFFFFFFGKVGGEGGFNLPKVKNPMKYSQLWSMHFDL